MAMNVSDLADEIKTALGQASQPTSAETKGMAKAIIDELAQIAVVNHALVTGVTAPGAPLQNGAAAGGLILGPSAGTLGPRFVAEGVAPSPTPQIVELAHGIATGIITSTVTFPAGKIQGTCTSTSNNPGPLAPGSGSGGKIVGVPVPLMAQLATASKGGPSPQVLAMMGAIAKHLMEKAEVTYAPGTVVGTCPPGGGPLAAGVGTGGTIQ